MYIFAYLRLFLLSILFCLPSFAAQVIVAVATTDGKPLRDALVIVQDLDHQEREAYRALTEGQGTTSPRELPPGLYRAIGTYPYSRWRSDVREFVITEQPVRIKLSLPEASTFDAVTVAIGRVGIRVVDAAGRPAAGARVLVRDANATPQSEHWGTTDAKGQTSLELTLEPAVLLVVYKNRLYSFPANTFDTERTLQLK